MFFKFSCVSMSRTVFIVNQLTVNNCFKSISILQILYAIGETTEGQAKKQRNAKSSNLFNCK